jgi:parallel beta-helix repeat protein
MSDTGGMPSVCSVHRIAAAAGAAATAAVLAFAPAASADVTCTKVAAPGGSDASNGSLETPYATAQKLVNSLHAGDTGCLRAGNYSERLKISIGGTADAPVTLTSFPGERATVTGRFWIAQGADYVTVANLDLNGKNDKIEPSPTVNANHSTFVDNDVTNDNTGICFLLGNGWGSAGNTLIQHNRIHNCGLLPAANHDHGIYVEEATDTEIRDNLIYDNADRGVQLYPNAQRTHIAGNVIDGNGEGVIISGLDDHASRDTLVEDNVITNSNQRNNVESWFPGAVGTNNIVRDNCIAGGVRDDGDGGIAEQHQGFTVGSGNVLSKNPKFVDRAGKDFRLQSDSPCAGIANGATGSNGARVTVAPPAPSTTTQPTSGSSSSTPRHGNESPAPAGPAVKLTTKTTRGGRVRLTGRVRASRRRALHSAGVTARRAVIQIRWAHAWFPVRSTRIIRGKRFRTSVRIPSLMRGRVLRLRASVPHVGHSHTVRVRTR